MRRLAAVALLFLFCVPCAGAWTWPVDGPVLAAFTFDAAHPYAAGQHRGIDIGAPSDATVVAPAAGTVTFAGTVPTSGKTLSLLTADSLAVTLTHLGSLAVAKGALVAEGAPVGTVGPSGTPELDVPYVHLGVRTAGEEQGYLDPLSFLPPLAPSAPPASPPAAAPVAPVAAPPEAAPAPAPAPLAAPADTPPSPPAEPAAPPTAAVPASAPASAPAPATAPLDVPAPPAETRPAPPAETTAPTPAPAPAAPETSASPAPAPAAAPVFDPAAPTAAPVAENDVVDLPAVPSGAALAPDAALSELLPLELFGIRPRAAVRAPLSSTPVPVPVAAGRVRPVEHTQAAKRTEPRARRIVTRAPVASIGAAPVRRVRGLPSASEPARMRAQHRLLLALLVAGALAVAALLARMIRSPFPRSEGASTVREDPRRPGLAVCERPASHRPRGGLRRAGGRVRALPPAEGRRRPHGERHGRARHARDGVRGPERRVAA